MKIILLSLSIWLLSLAPATHGEEITIAVAANFNVAMEELVAAYELQSGHKVNVSYGSSGRLYAQIMNGAPFQVFFSADQQKPDALIKEKQALAESRLTYAIGALVLWSANPALALKDAAVLRHNEVKRLAIANPRLAPYGAAAIQVLEALDLEYSDKLVMGENINQAFQFVVTGNAQAGLVSLSQVMQNNKVVKGAGWVIPTDLYNPIKQDAVLLNKGSESQTAREFLEFVSSPEAKVLISKYGYSHY